MNSTRSIWDELDEAVSYIRDQFQVNKIRLERDEEITKALDEAESLAKGRAVGAFDTTKPLIESVEEVHVVLALARDLRLCVQHGLPVGPHLRRMTFGSIRYGVPAAPNERTFFFKDFETELFVASTLVQAGLPVRFLEDSNDPRGEMEVEGVVVEVKHPDSPSSTLRHLTKFSNKLRPSREAGFFVRSIEDAFGLRSDRDVRGSAGEGQMFDEMEHNGLNAAEHAARQGNILGFATLASHLEVVAGESRFARKGAAVIFDEISERWGKLGVVERIASALGTQSTKWSDVGTNSTFADEAQQKANSDERDSLQ